jgi:hypothetical protein
MRNQCLRGLSRHSACRGRTALVDFARVKRHCGHRIFCIRTSVAWHQIAHSVTGWNHGAGGLAGGIRARHADISTLLDSGIASRITPTRHLSTRASELRRGLLDRLSVVALLTDSRITELARADFIVVIVAHQQSLFAGGSYQPQLRAASICERQAICRNCH